MLIKKNKLVKYSFLFLIILCFGYYIFILSKYLYGYLLYNQTYSILMVINLIAFLIVIKTKNNKHIHKSDLILSACLSLLFILILPISSIIDNNIVIESKIMTFIYVFSSIISVFICIIKIITYENKQIEIINLKKTRKKVLLIFILFTCIYLFSSNTGYYDHDFYYLWQGKFNTISNWHTFSYTLLVYAIKYLFNNPFPLLVIQAFLWIYSLNYSSKIIERETQSKKYLVIFSIIHILTIVGFKQISFHWKDVFFSVSLYTYFLIFFDCILLKKITLKKVIMLLLYSILICNFRHGGNILILFTNIILSIYFFINKNKKMIILSLAVECLCLIVCFGINFFCKNYLNGDTISKYVTYTVPIYQVGTFIDKNFNFSDKDIEYLETLYPIEVWKKNYRKNDGDSLTRKWRIPKQYALNLDAFDTSKLISLNLKLFINKPILYIKALMDRCDSIWKITSINNYNGRFYTYLEPLKYNGVDTTNNIVFNRTFLSKVTDGIDYLLIEKNPISDICTRGAFAVFMIIFSILLNVRNKQYHNILCIIPFIIWWFLLIISMPINLTRYCIVFIISWPIYFLISLHNNK